jgi:type IV pilus assembly protein PilX
MNPNLSPDTCLIKKRRIHRGRQEGVALVIALIMLVIMTLVGLSAIKTVTLEERMTAQTYDRSMAFQAAESGLREAEDYVESNAPLLPTVTGGCNSNGVCDIPVSSDTERWADSSFAGWKDATVVASGNISLTPQFIIEYLGATFPCQPGTPTAGSSCKRYRITAKSNEGSDRASVTLQSIYSAE